MIETADTVPSGSTIVTDLCIVGAGAAGISLALQFAKSRYRVLLVESGATKFAAKTQSLYEGRVTDPEQHSPAEKYRRRMFGGTTTVWGGRCVPLDPIDLETRPWAPLSGWPLDYQELTKYYPAANALCEAGDFDYAAATAVPGGMRPMIKGFEPEFFSDDTIERFSPPTDFGRRYREALRSSANIRVLLGANCTEIITAEDGGTVTKLILRTLSGKQFEVEAGQVVVAVGGLETPRLLLASQRHDPRGVGNGRDLVGRHYMSHIAGTVGQLRFHVPERDIWHGYERAPDGTYCRRRLALKPAVQRALGLGNIIMRLHHPRLSDPGHRDGVLSAIYLARPFISYEYAKRLYDRGAGGAYLGHIANVARTPLKTAKFLANLAQKRAFAARKFPSLIVASQAKSYSLDIHAEQLPNPESRVFLDTARDPLGMPRIAIDWRYSAWDINTVAESLRLLQDSLSAWGGATLTFDPDAVEANMLREGAYGGHHIGTARMAASPEAGVVDGNCRVFGIDNLYLAGSAVFPTSSQANPTLTIVALALRLADHLKTRLPELP